MDALRPDGPGAPRRMLIAASAVLAVALLALGVAGWSLLAAERRREQARAEADLARLDTQLRIVVAERVLARPELRITLDAAGVQIDPPPPRRLAPTPYPASDRLRFLVEHGGPTRAEGPRTTELLLASEDPAARLHGALRAALRTDDPNRRAELFTLVAEEHRDTLGAVHLGLLAGDEDARRRAHAALNTHDDTQVAALLVGTLGLGELPAIRATRDRRRDERRLRDAAERMPGPRGVGDTAVAEVEGEMAIAARRTPEATVVARRAITSVREAAVASVAASGARLVSDGPHRLAWWPGLALEPIQPAGSGAVTLVVSGLLVAAAAAVVAFVVFVRAANRAAHLARLRTEFVATVGHELRTPVAVIQTSAETLRRGHATTEEQRRLFLDAILRETRRLGGLLGNVLDFARMESGRKAWSFVTEDLRDLVREVVEEQRGAPSSADGRVELQLPADAVPCAIDRDALRTALANLVENALKFDPSGRPVTVNVIREEESSSALVQVVDHGLGVPDDQKARIFERFHRDPRPEVRATRGTGIGLALARHVAEAHGGTLGIRDTTGGGATFELSLPLGTDETPAADGEESGA